MAKSPDRTALGALTDALNALLRAAEGSPSAYAIRRIRTGLAEHAAAVELARDITDPIRSPRVTFDPSEPKNVGRMVSMALIAQERVPLGGVRPTYGSGVYAIYYEGDHPFYAPISGTETPIYVGKADPEKPEASTPREQGAKLTGRLIEHARAISRAEGYLKEEGLPPGLHRIRLADFSCRRLVCATNAQLVAERHLVSTFAPIWNSETKACWGISKHGDSAGTRSNRRSPWDVIHPGKQYALDERLVDSLSVEEIKRRIDQVWERVPPRTDHAALLEEMLAAFRQNDVAADLDYPSSAPEEDEVEQDDEERLIDEE